jgi:uncharacterized protein
MKLNESTIQGMFVIEHYDLSYICIDGIMCRHALFVSGDGLESLWPKYSVFSLDPFVLMLHQQHTLLSKYECILVGTGSKRHAPKSAELLQSDLSLEWMSTHAAVNTYRILREQGTLVAAFLFLEPGS